MACYFENTKYDINMTEEDEEGFKILFSVDFVKKVINSDKVRDYRHSTGKCSGSAHSKCIINVTQDKSNFIPLLFHNFSIYDCHLFFEKLIDKRNDKVNLAFIPKTIEEYISVRYGCIRFIDSYRFLSMSLDRIKKSFNEGDFKNLEKEFPNKWQLLFKKLAYPYENFNSIGDYMKPV